MHIIITSRALRAHVLSMGAVSKSAWKSEHSRETTWIGVCRMSRRTDYETSSRLNTVVLRSSCLRRLENSIHMTSHAGPPPPLLLEGA